MKKILPLLFLFGLILVPHDTHAGLSESCFPSVECDAGQDYYAGQCRPHIETVAMSCDQPKPGLFAAFSCDYGCYVQSKPDSQECAGGVIANGKCLTSLYLVDDADVNKIWDGATLKNLDGIWSLNGTSAYYKDGRVGIGTDVPTAALQVDGGMNNDVLTLNAGPGGGTALKATGSYSAILKGIAQIINGYPLRIVADNVEVAGSRVGVFRSSNGGNFINVGSESNHDFYLISNNTRRVTIGASGLVGINTLTPNFTLDVAGPLNLNKGLDGAALYTNGKQMLWYAGDWATWGLEANSNFFPQRVGIGTVGGSSSQLSVNRSTDSNSGNYGINNSNTNTSGSGSAYGIYNTAENKGSGFSYGLYNESSSNSSAYGIYNSTASTGVGEVFGNFNITSQTKAANVNTAFGVFSSATNSSASCSGQDCADAFGVYATTGNTTFGTGVYGEGRFYGVHAVAKVGGNGVGLLVENQQPDGIGSIFKCSGNCTSAIFASGNDAAANGFESGMVIIGNSGGSHLAFDDNEIMAKSNGSTASPLYLNADGGAVKLGGGGATYKLELDNVASNIGGRGLANAWNVYSDARVKFNQKDLTYGLSDLMKLEPKSYDHYSGKVENGKVELGKTFESTIGLIAQEVYKIIPQAVNRPEDEKNNLWTLDYDKLVPVLIKSIQDLKQEKDDEITALKKSNEALKVLVCQDHPEAELCR